MKHNAQTGGDRWAAVSEVRSIRPSAAPPRRSGGMRLQNTLRAQGQLTLTQVAAAEQQSLNFEAYASGAANATRWHEADKDAAQADAFGAALAGNTAWRPQVTPASLSQTS